MSEPTPGEKALAEAFEAIMEGLPQPAENANSANMHGTRFRFELDLTKPKEPPK